MKGMKKENILMCDTNKVYIKIINKGHYNYWSESSIHKQGVS